MALADTRSRLSRALDDAQFGSPVRWSTDRPLIADWWHDLKVEEAKDKFNKVFHESRMIVRYVKQGVDSTVDMKAHRGLTGGMETMTKPAPPSKVGGALAARMGAFQEPKTYKLGLGAKQLMDRMDPTNFITPTTGSRPKIELGLHDMSASLLDPKKIKISTQLFNQPKQYQIFAFMPVAAEDDQVVFQKINAFGKQHRADNDGLYSLVRELRSELTRIKLACEHDMATNFTAFAPDSAVNPKFRYGQSAQTKVPDPQKPGELVFVPNTAELINRRKTNALNYKAILDSEFHHNEITVAFRHHAGAFPKFGVWDGKGSFLVSNVASNRMMRTGEVIPDAPPND
jgi:hypothetical protein